MKTTFKIVDAAEPTNTIELWLEYREDNAVLIGRRNGGTPYSILHISDEGLYRYAGCSVLGLPTETPYGRISLNET